MVEMKVESGLKVPEQTVTSKILLLTYNKICSPVLAWTKNKNMNFY